MNTNHQAEHDPALQPTVDRLDALAQADRDAAPDDLASRLARTALETQPPSVLARIGPVGRGLRIAASAGLAASVGVVVVSRMIGPATPPAPNVEALYAEATRSIDDLLATSISGTGEAIWNLGTDPIDEPAINGATLWDLGGDLSNTALSLSDFEGMG